MDTHGDKLRDRLRRTVFGSAINAFAALLMVGAITFGATVIRPMTVDHDATTASATDDGSTAGNLDEPTGDKPAGDANGGEATDGDKVGEIDENYPTWKPSNKEEPKEEPAEEKPG